MPSPKEKQRTETIKKIIRRRNDALDQIHREMDRLGDRLTQIAEKVASGSKLTDAEKKERKALLEAIDELVAVETRAVLFTLNALDSSAQVKYLLGQVELANKELDETRKRVEGISETIKQAGDFLTAVAGVLTSLTGLLKTLA